MFNKTLLEQVTYSQLSQIPIKTGMLLVELGALVFADFLFNLDLILI